MRLSFRHRDPHTVLGTVYQQGCSKVRFPGSGPASIADAVLINTSGGLTDDDELDCSIECHAGANVSITTQAAERVYRSRGRPATIRSHLTLAAGSVACWLPQETILFDGARLDRRMEIRVEPGATLFAAEGLVFGRTASGEIMASGGLFDRWRIRISDTLVFADAVRLDDYSDSSVSDVLRRRCVANDARAVATAVYLADDCADVVPALRAALDNTDTIAGVSNLGPLTVIRVLAADSGAIRAALTAALEQTLGRGGRTGACLPRIWNC